MAADAGEGPQTAAQRQYTLDLVLDEAKLKAATSSEQGDIFLIQWLTRLETAIRGIDDVEMLKASQKDVLKTLYKLIHPQSQSDQAVDSTRPSTPSGSSSSPVPSSNVASSMPKPGRPARHLIARCLVLLLQRTQTGSLYDVGQTLLGIANDDPKSTRPVSDRESKTAALFVLGELFAAMGNDVMSVFVDIVQSTQRILKSYQMPVIVRSHATMCLQKALAVGGKSLSDQLLKELIKNLKMGLADKAGSVIRGCADCLVALCEETDFLSNRPDIDSILAAVFREIGNVDYVTKRSLSRLCASILSLTQRSVAPKTAATAAAAAAAASSSKSSKKKKRDNAAGDESEEEEANASAIAASQAAAVAAAGGLMPARDMLELLSAPFTRSASDRRTRVALMDVIATTVTTLGVAWVQTNYATILKCLIEDIPNYPTSVVGKSEILCVRAGVQLILRRVIGERMLGEQAQVTAVQEICSSYLKRYPVTLPGSPPPPSKYTLVLALSEVAGLLQQLGTAPPQIIDVLYDPLLRCLAHPSHSVQIHAAWCLRTLCYVLPTQLPASIQLLVQRLESDLQTLTTSGERGGSDANKRANGHSRGLAAVISVIPSRPLYTSFDVSARVLDMAVNLLRTCGEHSLPVSGVEIQVAWTLLSGLMALGPNFVRLHLPQLLLLWRNALPKPNGATTGRADAEWAFLLHVRESALGCVVSFLHHNAEALLSLDVARKIVAFLSHTLAFVDDFAAQHPRLSQEQVPGAERSSLSLLDREHMLRRSLFQCFSALATNTAIEPLQDSLVNITLQTFAEPDRYIGSAAQAAISAGSGNFKSIWAMQDAYAFGITSLQRDDENFVGVEDTGKLMSFASTAQTTRADYLNRDAIEIQIDALLRRPVLGSAEHDPLVVFARYDTPPGAPPSSPPAPTAMVDSALQLFAMLLPYQKRNLQIAALEAMLTYCRSNRLEKNPGRRAAVQLNSCGAILGLLRVAMENAAGVGGAKATGFNNDRMTTALREILKDALLQSDATLRAVSSQAFGRLAAVAGSHAMSSQVQFLVDQVVSNRDPDARAGCALAFGTTYSQVGGLSAGPLTKTVVNVLMSLSSDPHPTVHYSALQALRLVIDAASLSYSQYVSGTLGMLVKLSMLDTHEPEGGSAGSVNLRADLPAHQAICQVLSALIGVLGPDLRSSGKVRGLVQILLDEYSRERDDGVIVEATKARQHFWLFAPQELDLKEWIGQLSAHLRSRKRPRKLAAINGLYQLVQREALLVSRLGGDDLVADLFAQLDLEPSLDGVREILLSWLRQTADLSPGSWIDLCQRIINRSPSGQAKPQHRSAATPTQPSGALQDEEAATIDLGEDPSANVAALQGSRWRTQLFSLQCLHEVFAVVRRAGRLEHFGAPTAGMTSQQARSLMSNRVVDLVRMAFTASTASNIEIRLEGLVLLRDVIENFKSARDPDFQDALLLEQHQAPIAAALTPAFQADSTPEVLAAAVQVCAVFVGSGVVREVERMGRILKQLVTALERCTDTKMNSLGDVTDLSPNAAAMLKVAVFTAWSELYVASADHAYLVPVIEPHLDTLAPLWVGSLLEFARIKTDPDSSNVGLGMAPTIVINPSLDSEYAGLAREMLLPHYQRSWYKMIHAVSLAAGAGNGTLLAAMDGRNPKDSSQQPSAFRSEPALYFPVLYALAFEAIAVNMGATQAVQQAREVTRTSLYAISSLGHPQYAGTALLQDAIFSELCNLCRRLIATESAGVQTSVVELVVALVVGYGQRLLDGEDDDEAQQTAETQPPPKAKLTQLLGIIVSVLLRSSLPQGRPEELSALLRSAFGAYDAVANAYTPSTRADLYAVEWQLHSELLRDERPESVDLISPTLGCLRELCERSGALVASSAEGSDSQPLARTIHGYLSVTVNTIDELRGRSGRVATTKLRNCLLAATVVLTSLPSSPMLKISRAVLDQLCYVIPQKCDDEDEGIALTAAQCGRTLISAAGSKDTPALRYCFGGLLQGMVEFVVGKHKTARASILAEIFKAFEASLAVIPSDNIDHRARAMGVLLPTLILVLDQPVETEKGQSHSGNLCVQTLLQLATRQPAAFKAATAKLDTERRSFLETTVRNALSSARPGKRGAGGDESGAGGRSGEARIALKSFGAN